MVFVSLGVAMDTLGPLLGSLGGLGPLLGPRGRSWASLRASVDGRGPLSGSLPAVLGRSGTSVGLRQDVLLPGRP